MASATPTRASSFEWALASVWAPPASALDERHRRVVVRLVSAVYWLLIFEGVLRKWVAPQFGRELFFVRDPFVLLAYALVIARRTRFPRSTILEIACGFGAVGLIATALHVLWSPRVPTYMLVYGWRNYFLYIPLAFVTARYFTLWDVARLARGALIACIPMAALVVAQVGQPATSPLNAGSGEGPDAAYTVHTTTQGIVRPAGTFTSDLGLTAFVASSLAMAVAFWVLPARSRPIGRPLLAASTASLMVILGLSGSRGNVLWSGLVMAGAFVGLFLVAPRMHQRATALIIVVVACGVTFLPVLFPGPTQAFIGRWAEAGEMESAAFGGGQGGLLARVGYELVGFLRLIGRTPPLGYGLGTAGNAAWQSGLRDELVQFNNQDEANAAETDWGRNVLELGPSLGFAFILFRAAFAVRLTFGALAATRRSGNPFPWLLCMYVGASVFWGQITGNGTLNGFAWVFVGLCMAATLRARRYGAAPR
jgi:hypothetical protein